jgi:hypothetical protein
MRIAAIFDAGVAFGGLAHYFRLFVKRVFYELSWLFSGKFPSGCNRDSNTANQRKSNSSVAGQLRRCRRMTPAAIID